LLGLTLGVNNSEYNILATSGDKKEK